MENYEQNLINIREVMAQFNKAMTMFLLLAADEEFAAFMQWLQDEEYRKEYSRLRAEYAPRADAQGVVEIPFGEISPMLLRALTTRPCEAVCNAADEIHGGETGIFLGGHAYVHPLAHLPRISLRKGWVVKHPSTGVQVVRAGKVEFPEEPVEIDHCTRVAQETTPEVVVVELTRIWNDSLPRAEKTNQERILEQVLSRLEGLGMGVGWLVTTKTEVKASKQAEVDKPKKHRHKHPREGDEATDQSKMRKHWLKVGAVLQLSAKTLDLVPQVAADLVQSLLWMGLDKTNVNISVRFGTPDGIWEKDHTRGLQAVEALEGGARFAKHFRDKKSKKAGSWRIAQVSLPKSSSEDPDLAEFHSAIAARNASVQPPLDPIVEEVAPVKEVPEWLRVSWADDDEDDDELDYSILPVMPTLPSRQEPATPAKEESEAPTPVAPKKKNRRGTRGKGRAC